MRISRRRFYAEIACPIKNGDPKIAVSFDFDAAGYRIRRSFREPKLNVANMSRINIQKLTVGTEIASPIDADDASKPAA